MSNSNTTQSNQSDKDSMSKGEKSGTGGGQSGSQHGGQGGQQADSSRAGSSPIGAANRAARDRGSSRAVRTTRIAARDKTIRIAVDAE